MEYDPIHFRKKSKSKNSELTLAVAQQWYYETQEPVAQMAPSTRSGSSGTLVKPWWEKGKENKRGRYEVVETPLKTRGGHLMMDNETALNFDPLEPDKSIRNVARMVVMKDLKTSDIRSFIMIFVGSYNYLRTSKNMGRNSYLYRDQDFDGSVFFYTLDGQFLNGWRYTKGKITGTISKSYRDQSSREITTRAWVKDCDDICYTRVEQECGDKSYWENDDEWGATLVVEGYCDEVIYEDCYEICISYDDGDDEDWNDEDPPGSAYPPITGGGGSGSGSGGSGNTDTKYNFDSSMTEVQKQAIKSIIANSGVTDKVLNSLETKRVNIKINSNLTVPASYDPVTNTITFKNIVLNSDSERFAREELFHAFQDRYYTNGITQYLTTRRASVEFEAKVYCDIIQGYKDNTGWVNTLTVDNDTDALLKYNDWLSGATNEFDSTISMNLDNLDGRYNEMLGYFLDNSLTSGYGTSTTSYVKLNAVKQAFK